MESEKTMPFGKKLKCGNYLVQKYVKTLGKAELKMLRDEVGIPKDMRKHLQRGGLPFIKVEALSGIWSLSVCCTTSIFRMIDTFLPVALDDEDSEVANLVGKADFIHMFNMMFADTMMVGDADYYVAKANAFKAYVERQKAPVVSDEDEEKTLDDLKRDEDAKAVVVDMVNELKKEVDND